MEALLSSRMFEKRCAKRKATAMEAFALGDEAEDEFDANEKEGRVAAVPRGVESASSACCP
jgi:hypothetical protein